MNYVKYGETDWDEGSTKRNEFIKLRSDGEENQVRIITKPHKFGTHHIKFPDDPNKKFGGGRRIRCAGEQNTCILCKLAKAQEKSIEIKAPEWAKDLLVQKFKPRWYLGVLITNANPPKAGILEIGPLIRNRLKDLNNNRKWGDPRNYDVTITINPKATSSLEFYSVDGDPDSRGPLDPAWQKYVEDFDISELSKRCEPVSNEDIEGLVLRYKEWIEGALAETGTTKPQTKKAETKKEVTKEETEDSEDDDSDFDFKSEEE